jgi:hypothetical protein
MNRIVELLIDFNNQELDDLGVEIMSLVDKPAIKLNWMAFAEEEVLQQKYEDTILEMCKQESFGEFYDPAEYIFLDLNREEFADGSEIVDAITAIDRVADIVGSFTGKIMYRYTGTLRPNSRFFCLALIGLNKLYTAQELVAMSEAASTISSSLYPGGTRIVNAGTKDEYIEGGIAEWKGGPNCGHYWQKLEVFPNGVANVLGPAGGEMGTKMRDMSNNGYRMSWQFSDDEKQIVTGPAMVPNQMILRQDEDGMPFHVFFSEETIQKIAEKFLANNYHNNTDVNHSNQVTNENTLLESWIVEDPELDKSKKLGFEVPRGTWMISMKINNADTWQKIKNGELNGYSVTGNFLEKIIK